MYRELHDMGEFQTVFALQARVWSAPDDTESVPPHMMNAIAHAGGLVLGAYDDDELIGFALAFPARINNEWWLWSHMAGVLPGYRGRGIGRGLKHKQREIALERHFVAIGWTFDPMRRGNAYFNLHHLGATADEYALNVYGEMTDPINVGLRSDRLRVTWCLGDPRVAALASGSEAPPLVRHYPPEQFLLWYDGTLHTQNTAHPTCFVEIPYDLDTLKQQNKALAAEWQDALGRVLGTAFAMRYRAVDFVQDHAARRCWYILERTL